MKLEFTVPESLAGARIDKALPVMSAEAGDKLSRRYVKSLIDKGAVRVDGKPVRLAATALEVGAHIEVMTETRSSALIALTADDIVFEDDWVIAVNKRSGLPSHPTRDPNRDNMLSALERYLWAREGVEPYVIGHHRLDRDTTGVLIFGLHPDTNSGFTDAFRDRLAQKTYLAIAVPPESARTAWTVENHLLEERRGRIRLQTVVQAGGQFARTDFQILATQDNAVLVQARPGTGRMHQIRIHLAEDGMPIVGDTIYGGPERVGDCVLPRVMLHAQRLELPHPVIEGETLTVEAPIPADFQAVLDRLFPEFTSAE